MTRSELMKQAWKFAKGMAAKAGVGKPYEYIAEAMRRAWAIFKGQLNLKKKRNTEFVPGTPLKGMMTEKQERFIASLIRQGKFTTNPLLQAFNISSLRSTITKQQASELIGELLNA